MPTITDIAICIRTWDFSETSQTVSLFSREHGIVRGLAKGAKRTRGTFSGGFDILARGQVVAIIKRNSDLAVITEWDLQEVCWPIRRRLDAYRTAMYIADLVHHTITDHDPHAELFDALVRVLDDLEDAQHMPLALLQFQLDLLRAIGYAPELNGDSSLEQADESTCAFSPGAGGVVADTGEPDRWRVRRETIDLVRRVQVTKVEEEIDEQKIDHATILRANRLLAAYLRHLIGREPPAMTVLFPDLHG